MTVLFVPDYSAGNPYQENLAASLSEPVTYGQSDSSLPVLRALLTEDISVVHVHWLNIYFTGENRREVVVGLALFFLRLAAFRLSGVAVVWTVHNVRMHESTYPRVERYCKRLFVRSSCDRLVVHCDAVTDRLLAELDLPERLRRRVTVIPHGHYIDNYDDELSRAEARDRLDLPASKTVFLFFGLIRRYKGVTDLVDAFERLGDTETALVVAGNPKTDTLRADLSRRTATTPRMHGVYEYVPNDDIQTYMNAADAVVLPYRDITTSGSAVLAMSFGKALVVPTLGCLPELLDESGAVLYDPTTEDALVDALDRATTRDLDAMGRHNLVRIRTDDWETIAARTQAVYDSVRNQSTPEATTADATV